MRLGSLTTSRRNPDERADIRGLPFLTLSRTLLRSYELLADLSYFRGQLRLRICGSFPDVFAKRDELSLRGRYSRHPKFDPPTAGINARHIVVAGMKTTK